MRPGDEEQHLARLLASEASIPAVAELRERVPNAAELSSLASRLASHGLDVVSQPPALPPGTWKKWLVVGSGVSAAIVGWAVLRAPDAPLSLAPVAGSQALAPEQRELPSHTPSPFPLAASESPSRAAEPARRPAGEIAEPSPAGEVAPSESVGAASAARPGTGAAPAAVQPAEAPSPATAPRRLSSPLTKAAPTSDSPELAGAAAAPSEIELLREARLALRSSPASALAVTEQHGRLYPRGKLTQERELIAISALMALGRRTAALSRVSAFERAFPGSPYRKQIADLLR